MTKEYCPICGKKITQKKHTCPKKILKEINKDKWPDVFEDEDEELSFDDKMEDYEAMIDPEYLDDDQPESDDNLLNDGFTLF